MNEVIKRKRNGSVDERVVLASELYYMYNLSQEEISKQLGVSRPWVSKLLKQAEEAGIVRVEVMTPTVGITDMEVALEKRYKIKKSKVIKYIPGIDHLKNIGRTAANYIVSILKPDDVIGVSWGWTLSFAADAFIPLHYPNVKVIPLVGGLGRNPEILSNQVAIKLATSLGAQSHLLHAPAFTVGKEEKDIFLRDPFITEIINEGEKATIAILGMGSLHESTIHKMNYVSTEEIDELERLGAVGDVALSFIDNKGRKIEHSVHDRIVGADLVAVRENARELIGVAVGKNKVPVIRAALEGNWVNVLVTDVDTAEELLK